MHEFSIPVTVKINYPHWLDCLKLLRIIDKPRDFPWVTEDMVSRSLLQSFVLLYDYYSGEKISGVKQWLKSMYTPQPMGTDMDFIYKVMLNTNAVSKLEFGFSQKHHYLSLPKQDNKETDFLKKDIVELVLRTGVLHNPYIIQFSLFEKIRMLEPFELVKQNNSVFFKQSEAA